MGITIGSTSTYTFTKSSSFTSSVSLFSSTYTGNGCAGGYLNSTTTLTQTMPGTYSFSGNSFSQALTAGSSLSLAGFSTGSGTSGDISVTFSGGTLFSGVAPPPAGYSYTYGITNQATGNIVAFSATSDLSNASNFPAGDYRVFGLSYQNGTNLSTYVGGTKANLQNAAALQTICAATSSNEVTVTITSALPVELISLSAKPLGNENQLDWATATELATEEFGVQRLDKDEWIELGRVAALNSAQGGFYRFLDFNPPAGRSLYRLEIRDLDGSVAYSDMVSVSRKTQATEWIEAFPNPNASGILSLRYRGDVPFSPLSFTITDLTGREISAGNLTAGSQLTAEIQLPAAPGIYLLNTEDAADGRRQTLKIVRGK